MDAANRVDRTHEFNVKPPLLQQKWRSDYSLDARLTQDYLVLGWPDGTPRPWLDWTGRTGIFNCRIRSE
jgi:hypothetical protein